ncbi:tripartite tricarboxylate transporter TctB family protein [Noviherbaspirillum massiliense]|uniref:tripartite tricarboxylate transporter TctB family protein n=1 Tax=Noviherbaspirillum massiliense TaxID=1465823 RepID=UPI0002DFB821|nr:tripartite tricarboxylate transporter TctB family protein [Noviherbaspirillum massiliense]
MPAFIRNPKDFWSGVIFIAFALVAIFVGRDYSMGSAARMGPAYFPTILGGLLGIIGAVSVIRSFVLQGEPVEKLVFKNIALVTLSVVLFGFLLRGAGLFLSVIVLVMVSGFASSRFKVLPFLAVAVFMAVFSVLVFVKGLSLPMPMFGSWFGF